MRTALEVGAKLQEARRDKKLRVTELVEKTGLTAVTLRGLLDGKTDARLSTLIAVAHEVGLELVLVPKEIAQSFESRSMPHVAVESFVSRALVTPSNPRGKS
jgi:transcriptional regulator with XRE-family HTH domain